MDENFVHLVEQAVKYPAHIGIAIAELSGIAILMFTVVKCIVNLIRKRKNVRLDLAEGIALALEFKLGGEVLHTVTTRTTDELFLLGGIVMLRAALTLLIHWEISVEEKREKAMPEEAHKD